MLILILGVALFWAAHLFKRVMPGQYAALGKRAYMLSAGLSVLSIILMIWGYKIASGPYWWGPEPALVGINNLLVLIGVYLFAAAGMKTGITSRLRHPMLIGFVLWAVGHLLVNGDLPSFVLFGGLLVWALVEIAVINRAEAWSPPDRPFVIRKESMAAGGAVIVFLVAGLYPQPAWTKPVRSMI